AARHRAVLADAVEEIVVQMAGGDVVDASVPLVGVRHPVVAHRDRGEDVVGPAHSDRLVLVTEGVPGERDVGGVVAHVHQPVAQPGELVVGDPSVGRGGHADPVVVVLFALSVPGGGDAGVPEGQVPDDRVRHGGQAQAATGPPAAATGSDDRGVRGDVDHRT